MANHEEELDPETGDEYVDEEGGLLPEEENFGNWATDQFRRTPWFLTSLLLHIFIIMMVVILMPPPELGNAQDKPITATLPAAPKQKLEEPEKAEVMTDKEILDKTNVEEPVVSERTDDHNETDNDEEHQQAKGDPDSNSTADLTGESNLDGIGIGGGAGGHFGGRLGGKADLVRGGGGGLATENAVTDALRWLKRHQAPDGSWDVDGFTERCDPVFGAACDGKGNVTEGDPALTGLALLAYLGAGYTHDDGSEFAETVRKALKYLKDVQRDDGIFAKETTSHFYMYGHSIATLAMTEAFGLTGAEIFKSPAERGLEVIIKAQNDHPEKPGEKYAWRYFPNDGDNDTSVTGWMTMALKSAKAIGLHVPDTAFDGVRNWVDYVTDDVYYRAGYQTTGGGSAVPEEDKDKFRATESTTAIAILCRVFIGEKPTAAKIKGGAALLNQDRPVWNESDGSVDYYYWYYGTLAMFQVGGDAWKEWNEAMKESIVDHQLKREHGCQWGSWDPKPDKWGMRGGRVYATAINCLTLEVYYRYDRVFK